MVDRPFLGEVLSLATSLIWSISVILFRKSGNRVNPLALNLLKNTVSFVLLSLTLLVLGRSVFPERPMMDYVLLFLSGVIGIAVSDTMFFASLNILGASSSAIVDCVYSPFVVLFGFVLVGEQLSLSDLAGGVLIVSAVFLTSEDLQKSSVPKKELTRGILLGVLAMATTAFAIASIKPILNVSPLLWATNVRILGGVFGIVVLAQFLPSARRKLWDGFTDRKSFRHSLPSAVLGGYLVLPLWVGGMKYTTVGVAAILNQMSTVFIVLWAALFLKESLTVRKSISVALAFTGALLILHG